MASKRNRRKKDANPFYQEPFIRRLPDGFGEVALGLFLLPPLIERVWLTSGQLVERYFVYSLWLLPAMVLSYYLGKRGAGISIAVILPLLLWNLNRYFVSSSVYYALLTAYFSILTVFLILAGVMAEKFRRQVEMFRQEAVTDELSGLFNHRFFYRCLEQEIDRARRYKHPLSVVLIDLNNFKKYNDTWGHLQGDRALRALAVIMRETLRTPDILARYGGEEFAIVLPQTNLVNAKRVCERIREALAAKSIPSPDGDTGHLTASFGVASYEKNMTASQLVGEADRVLYYTKSSGKNLFTAIRPESQ